MILQYIALVLWILVVISTCLLFIWKSQTKNVFTFWLVICILLIPVSVAIHDYIGLGIFGFCSIVGTIGRGRT